MTRPCVNRRSRRGGRVVDGSGLENRRTRKGTGGSNPSPPPPEPCGPQPLNYQLTVGDMVYRHRGSLSRQCPEAQNRVRTSGIFTVSGTTCSSLRHRATHVISRSLDVVRCRGADIWRAAEYAGLQCLVLPDGRDCCLVRVAPRANHATRERYCRAYRDGCVLSGRGNLCSDSAWPQTSQRFNSSEK